MPSRRIRSIVIGSLALALSGVAALVLFRPSGDAASMTQSRVPSDEQGAETSLERVPPLVFAANTSDGYRLYASRADGTERTKLVASRGLFPSWSPDGHNLAYVGEARASQGKQLAVRMIGPDGQARMLVTGTQVPSNPAFRGNDQVFYEAAMQESAHTAGVSATTSIDVVDVSGGSQRTEIYSRGATYHPTWSPDGTRLAYVKPAPGCDSTEKRHCPQPLVVEGNGQRTSAVTTGVAANPSWSPDGRALAYSWTDDGGVAHIWVVRPGSRPQQVTSGTRVDNEPTWSPDGRRIAFTRGCDLWVQPLNGGEPRNISRTQGVCEISPAWRPNGT